MPRPVAWMQKKHSVQGVQRGATNGVVTDTKSKVAKSSSLRNAYATRESKRAHTSAPPVPLHQRRSLSPVPSTAPSPPRLVNGSSALRRRWAPPPAHDARRPCGQTTMGCEIRSQGGERSNSRARQTRLDGVLVDVSVKPYVEYKLPPVDQPVPGPEFELKSNKVVVEGI